MTTASSIFGTSPRDPIRVGGGFLFGAFNQRQYLSRLRTTNGQSIEFSRRGNLPVADAPGPLDIYELSGEELAAPLAVLLDIYTRGELAPIAGFTLVDAQQLANLPLGLGSAADWADGGSTAPAGARRWRVVSDDEKILGFADWDGAEGLRLAITPNLEQLIRRQVEHFIAIAPAYGKAAVLCDYFERCLPLDSGGLVRGVPVALQPPAPWTGALWGETPAPNPARKWYRPW